MEHLFATKKPTFSRSTQSGSSPTTGSQETRQAKSTPYKRSTYEGELARRGSHMKIFYGGISEASRELCQTLLSSEQTYPQNSLFCDRLFDTTCEKIRNRNEAMVIRDISLLIVPSAQTLATYGATHLCCLAESVNEAWDCAIPFHGPRPQPNYSVGFSRAAFSDSQLEKLEPFVGETTYRFTSLFMATSEMYFPFLTSEVKRNNASLAVADRQNAHSMTLALRGRVELFRLVKREEELHREILAFSISHDNGVVGIYGHYPVINKDKTSFYRHPIDSFVFKRSGGKEKWTAYRFTKKIYSAINELPIIKVLQQSEPRPSGPSQGPESHHSDRDSISLPEENGSQSSSASPRNVKPCPV